jgi:hypothetical protein
MTQVMVSYQAQLPNYAMKATTVEYLALNLATGPVAPYFGCYALVVKTQLCNKH